jgi:hypothetical protein
VKGIIPLDSLPWNQVIYKFAVSVYVPFVSLRVVFLTKIQFGISILVLEFQQNGYGFK